MHIVHNVIKQLNILNITYKYMAASLKLFAPEYKSVSIEQVNPTLATIIRLQTVIPEVIKIIEDKL